MKHTEEERKAYGQRMRKLIKAVSDMSPEERERVAARMPIITCEGHPLSFYNHCFLGAQQDNGRVITIVAGFNQWNKAGRRVRKGEHSIGSIYVPMLPKSDDDTVATEDRELRFRLVPVFDITQTEEASLTS